MPTVQELTGVLSARDFVGWYNGYPGLETVSETAVVGDISINY